MTSPSSIAAYHAIPNLEERQDRVYSVLAKCPGASSNDIARIAKMNPKNVRNRIVELRNQGQIKLVGKKKDRLTGYEVNQYEIVEVMS